MCVIDPINAQGRHNSSPIFGALVRFWGTQTNYGELWIGLDELWRPRAFMGSITPQNTLKSKHGICLQYFPFEDTPRRLILRGRFDVNWYI